jgi:hypothetical protein
LVDPSAYYLTAWLPDAAQMRSRSIVADYVRRPSTAENQALELMLANAGAALNRGDFAQVETLLHSVQIVCDQIESQEKSPFAASPLAADYYAIVRTVLQFGYQPQLLELTNTMARVWARISGPELTALNLFKTDRGWKLGGETLWFLSRKSPQPVTVLWALTRK